MKKKVLFYLSGMFLLIAIILMAQPTSTSLTFAPGPEETKVVAYSYFSFSQLLGYANFGPPLTAVGTIAWITVFCWEWMRGGRLERKKGRTRILAVICSALSLLALVTTNDVMVLGILICLSLILAAILQFISGPGK